MPSISRRRHYERRTNGLHLIIWCVEDLFSSYLLLFLKQLDKTRNLFFNKIIIAHGSFDGCQERVRSTETAVMSSLSKEDAPMHNEFTPFFRSTVGFDRLFDAIDRANEAADGYPPYNIAKTGADAYRVTLAVAGFATDEIDIVVQENFLSVSAATRSEPAGTLLHHGMPLLLAASRTTFASTARRSKMVCSRSILRARFRRRKSRGR
jgi:hypothetical protein